MNILVLSGSPRKNGNTQIMTAEFIKGAREAGHNVTEFNAGTMNIHPCIACESCLKNDGKCFRQDDMQKIYPAVEESDMIVFASPIYWYSLTAQIKSAIDRLYAFLLKGFKIKCSALLLNAHDSSPDVFNTAISNYNQIITYAGWENKGIITVSGMEFKGAMNSAHELKDVYELGRTL
ncbi:MAG: flavodoxin family protein [Bacillota bacterium]|nr:flavodoxin family protein [Bacillota bacterium]